MILLSTLISTIPFFFFKQAIALEINTRLELVQIITVSFSVSFSIFVGLLGHDASNRHIAERDCRVREQSFGHGDIAQDQPRSQPAREAASVVSTVVVALQTLGCNLLNVTTCRDQIRLCCIASSFDPNTCPFTISRNSTIFVEQQSQTSPSSRVSQAQFDYFGCCARCCFVR